MSVASLLRSASRQRRQRRSSRKTPSRPSSEHRRSYPRGDGTLCSRTLAWRALVATEETRGELAGGTVFPTRTARRDRSRSRPRSKRKLVRYVTLLSVSVSCVAYGCIWGADLHWPRCLRLAFLSNIPTSYLHKLFELKPHRPHCRLLHLSSPHLQ